MDFDPKDIHLRVIDQRIGAGIGDLNTQEGLDIILSEGKKDVKGMSNPGDKDYEV